MSPLPRLPACPWVFAVLFLAARPALAHDLWLEREAQGWTLYQGHRHSAHTGAEIVPYPADFVRSVLCLDVTGRAKPLPIDAKTTPWRSKTDCALLRIEVSSGFWSKTPWETKNVPKTQAPGAIRSWRSEESLKRLLRWFEAAANPLGHGLEITPLADPLRLTSNEKLTVRITLDGRPLANAPVALNGETRGTSDGDGRINLRLRRAGLQSIATSHETPLDDGQADWLVRGATLQFETIR